MRLGRTPSPPLFQLRYLRLVGVVNKGLLFFGGLVLRHPPPPQPHPPPPRHLEFLRCWSCFSTSFSLSAGGGLPLARPQVAALKPSIIEIGRFSSFPLYVFVSKRLRRTKITFSRAPDSDAEFIPRIIQPPFPASAIIPNCQPHDP